MFATDIYNCIRHTGFKLILWIYIFFCFVSFIICVHSDLNTHYQFIRSADENFFLMGTETNFLLSAFIVLFPISSCMISSQSFFQDVHSGRDISQIQRCNPSSYIKAKVFSTITLTFLCSTIPLFLNLLLCHLIYPSIGYDNQWGEPNYNIGIWSYNDARFLDLLRMEHPTCFNIIHIVILGIFAVLIALLALGTSIIIQEKFILCFIIPIIITLIITVISSILEYFSLQELSIYNYLLPNCRGNIWGFLLLLISWIIIDVLIIYYGSKNFKH